MNLIIIKWVLKNTLEQGEFFSFLRPSFLNREKRKNGSWPINLGEQMLHAEYVSVLLNNCNNMNYLGIYV